MGFDANRNLVDDPPGIRQALIEGGLQSIDKTVTTAQVLALFATPVSVIPAPAAGKALVFQGAMITKFAGTAYGGIAAGEDLVFKYTDASGAQVSLQVETTGFLDQATSQTRWVGAPRGASATVGDLTPVAAAAVVLHLLVGEVITGTSDLLVRAFYREISVPLSF